MWDGTYADYTAVEGRMLTMVAHTVSVSTTVVVLQDNTVEKTETYLLSVADASLQTAGRVVTIADGVAVGEIRNEDCMCV